MTTLQEILQKAQELQKTANPNLGLHISDPIEISKLWTKAKTEVTKKTPHEWFDIILKEDLQASNDIKTESDLKYYGHLKKIGNVTELERIKKTYGLFSMTVRIDTDTPKSCVLLYNPSIGKLYRYPDWDSYIGSINDDKKKHKAKNRV